MSRKPKAEPQKLETSDLKKPYARPRLVEYGNVAKLTASGGSVTPADSKPTMF